MLLQVLFIFLGVAVHFPDQTMAKRLHFRSFIVFFFMFDYVMYQTISHATCMPVRNVACLLQRYNEMTHCIEQILNNSKQFSAMQWNAI